MKTKDIIDKITLSHNHRLNIDGWEKEMAKILNEWKSEIIAEERKRIRLKLTEEWFK